MRNVVPRQGTEKEAIPLPRLSSLIEKCSSPTGDGNPEWKETPVTPEVLRNVVPRQGTEILNTQMLKSILVKLRNVVPRQGTENQSEQLSVCITVD